MYKKIQHEKRAAKRYKHGLVLGFRIVSSQDSSL